MLHAWLPAHRPASWPLSTHAQQALACPAVLATGSTPQTPAQAAAATCLQQLFPHMLTCPTCATVPRADAEPSKPIFGFATGSSSFGSFTAPALGTSSEAALFGSSAGGSSAPEPKPVVQLEEQALVTGEEEEKVVFSGEPHLAGHEGTVLRWGSCEFSTVDSCQWAKRGASGQHSGTKQRQRACAARCDL